jgi:hypothetical protein
MATPILSETQRRRSAKKKRKIGEVISQGVLVAQ